MRSVDQEYELEVSCHDDEYDDMLEQLQSQVNSLSTASESDTRSDTKSVYSAQSEHKQHFQRESTNIGQTNNVNTIFCILILILKGNLISLIRFKV